MNMIDNKKLNDKQKEEKAKEKPRDTGRRLTFDNTHKNAKKKKKCC